MSSATEYPAWVVKLAKECGTDPATVQEQANNFWTDVVRCIGLDHDAEVLRAVRRMTILAGRDFEEERYDAEEAGVEVGDDFAELLRMDEGAKVFSDFQAATGLDLGSLPK